MLSSSRPGGRGETVVSHNLDNPESETFDCPPIEYHGSHGAFRDHCATLSSLRTNERVAAVVCSFSSSPQQHADVIDYVNWSLAPHRWTSELVSGGQQAGLAAGVSAPHPHSEYKSFILKISSWFIVNLSVAVHWLLKCDSCAFCFCFSSNNYREFLLSLLFSAP